MLQELPVLQEPREHKVLQALPDLPAHRDRLAPPDPQDHRGRRNHRRYGSHGRYRGHRYYGGHWCYRGYWRNWRSTNYNHTQYYNK